MDWNLFNLLYALRKAYEQTGNPDDFPDFKWLSYALGEWADEPNHVHHSA